MVETVSFTRRLTVSSVVWLSFTVGLFSVGTCFLFESKKDDVPHLLALLIEAVAISLAVVALGFRSKFRDEKRFVLTKSLAWASVLMPLEAFFESAIHYRGAWFLTIPAQLIMGGLFGISFAILRGAWGWMVWGLATSLYGIFWVVTILFFAH